MRFLVSVLTHLVLLGTTMTIKLQPVAFDKPATVTGVQLLNATHVQLLASSQGSLMVEAEDKATGFTKALQLGGIPGMTWDARLDGKGVTAVYTQPGSAVSWVMMRNSGDSTGTRLNSESFAVYVRPHFVKGPGVQVTAIHLSGGKAQVTLFNPGSRTLPPSLPVGEPQGAITDARMLPTAGGYWLFTLSRVPGVGGDATPRRTVSGSQMPGILQVTKLGEDLKPLGKPAMVFGARPVYEFDVDTAPGNELAVLATTPAGLIYVRSTLAEVPVHENFVMEMPYERPLSSPSLVMHDGKPFCAAVANMGTSDAQVLRGEMQ